MYGTSAFVLPDLIGSGLWTAIANLIVNYWEGIVLSLGLLLFEAFAGLAVAYIRGGAREFGRWR